MIVLSGGVAAAFPGPESVAVLANADDPESLALARKYMDARSVPALQLCALSLPKTDDITYADYAAKLDGPFEACLKTAGVLDRIEAVVLMRGVPLRVGIPVNATTENVSVAAALGVWRTTLDAGGPLLGQPSGQLGNCGGPCLAAKWVNPLLYLTGPFEAGTSIANGGATWKPLLVTMLHGRTYADAALLIQSAVDAEKKGGAAGTFLFMDGADSARGALDVEYPGVIKALKTAGFSDASEVPFKTDQAGGNLAAFFTGTASLGTTLEGSTFAPGALVDNLTSFGAVPQNFAATGESQVSIARWVAKGVGGVHGTVDEPLNNCFPSRKLILDYTAGAPLSEAYLRRMPFVYWRNLVLGDPLLAPYAKRPVVTLAGLAPSASVAQLVTVTAKDLAGSGIAKIQLFVDGKLLVEGAGDTLVACVPVHAGKTAQILAVAQNAVGAGALAKFPPKGWASVSLNGTADGIVCAPPGDGGADGGVPGGGASDPGANGCSCRSATGGAGGPGSGAALALGVLVLVRRRLRNVALEDRASAADEHDGPGGDARGARA